jgi:hypothetical protein
MADTLGLERMPRGVICTHPRTYLQKCTVNAARSVETDLEVHGNGRNGTKGQGHHGDGGAGSTAGAGGRGRGSGSGR